MNSRDIQYFETVSEYCDEIDATVKRFGADFKTFCSDSDYYNSVLMTLFQIGELVNKLSDDARAVLDEQIESHKIVAVRNRIAHAYDGLDEAVIWDIVSKHLTGLKNFCIKQVEENAHLLADIDIELIENFTRPSD